MYVCMYGVCVRMYTYMYVCVYMHMCVLYFILPFFFCFALLCIIHVPMVKTCVWCAQVTVTETGRLNIHGWLPFSTSKSRSFTFHFDPNIHFDRYVFHITHHPSPPHTLPFTLHTLPRHTPQPFTLHTHHTHPYHTLHITPHCQSLVSLIQLVILL